MGDLTLTRGTTEGFETIEIDTGELSLTLIPALGGKISSLRDARSGREWLWRHPRMAYRRVPHGSEYVQTADTGGWDECFPSVSACAYPTAPWAGVPVQDHGELWNQPAALSVHKQGDSVALHARWEGVLLPYTFERTLTLRAGSARVHSAYVVTSRADEPLPYIWSAHPLLAIEPGMQLLLPPNARFNYWRTGAGGTPVFERGLPFPPEATAGGRTFDLATLPPRDAGVALKLWSDPLGPGDGWAGVRAHDGALAMRWDVAALPQVACWLNLGARGFDGGAPYFNLGLEPCIGAQDSLAEAVNEYKLFATLPPRETREWWLEVELSV